MAPGDGIGAAVTGNVKNPAWQQGKVNLGEYPKLPPAAGLGFMGSTAWRRHKFP